jgi:serralysin
MASLPATRPMIGTNQDDVLNGTQHSDVMSGRFGDDFLKGHNGNDEVWGGTGNDTLYGNNGDDKLYGSGGPNLVQINAMEISGDHPVSVVFEGETAGYRNTFGYYKVDDDGTIQDVKFIWPNASLQGSGGDLVQGQSREYLDVQSGDKIAFFIVSNGYSLNNGFSGLDLENGSLQFLNADGSAATLQSDGPQLFHVAPDGTQTLIKQHAYHTAAHDETVGLNPDNILHTTGVLKTDAGTITLGFEDLFNGGDRDFDDSVFTVDIGLANALLLNAHYQQQTGGTDPDPGAGVETPVIERTDNDILYGGDGADELHGRSGDDRLYGNNGQDDLHGGSGNDELYGNSGNDNLYGNSGDDVLYGGQQHDNLNGNSGNDALYGESGDDQLNGGTGDDTLDGGNGIDLLIGGSGDDILFGGYGDDTLKGGAGNDQLRGGHNDDKLYGGHDDDIFYGDAGNDFMHGGKGNDTVDYSSFDVDLSVSLHNKRAHGQEIGTDTLRFIDNIISGGGDDILKGSSGDNVIDGGAGDDQIRSLKGNDVLTGGEGIDTFVFRTYDLTGTDLITDFDIGIDLLDFSHLAGQNDDQTFLAKLQASALDGDTTLSVDLAGNGTYQDVCTLNDVGNQSVTSLFENNCFIF